MEAIKYLLVLYHIVQVLAHLSLSYCDHLPSVVVRPSSTALNIFCSEAPAPIFFKSDVEPSVKGGLKIYTNGYGLLVKKATMPTYGENN